MRGDSALREIGPLGEPRASDAPTALALFEMEEQFNRLLERLPDKTLQQIAIDKMHGHTNQQIADRLAVTSRTVERKLGLIRRYWAGSVD